MGASLENELAQGSAHDLLQPRRSARRVDGGHPCVHLHLVCLGGAPVGQQVLVEQVDVGVLLAQLKQHRLRQPGQAGHPVRMGALLRHVEPESRLVVVVFLAGVARRGYIACRPRAPVTTLPLPHATAQHVLHAMSRRLASYM